jgi:isoamylase
LCFRGIDNAAYYRLAAENPRYYIDYVGVGNTLNVREPFVLQMIMDSLRYWVQEMHVDGFRFDAASALARELHEVDRLSAFFDLVQQDPVIGQVKLIAEPWDLGEGGYQVGNFPVLWSEWNGRYRDTVRDYWRGAEHTLGDLAYRLTGSSDVYESGGRRPCASINFVTCHDGFTLEDLVSFEHKHNEANRENNRDGSDDNRSWNCGAEGPTADADVLAMRARQKRNFLATLLLSQGIPMLLGGDEMGRTQRGNNNAYCQDNEISWFDWEQGDETLIEFVSQLCKLRREHPVFRRHRWFQGRPVRASGVADIAWFEVNGREMTDPSWEVPAAKSIQVYLSGQHGPDPGSRGEPIRDSSFLLLLHAGSSPLEFRLPDREWGDGWVRQLDTSVHGVFGSHQPLGFNGVLELEGHSLVLLRSAS